ncbi:Ethr (predicted) [Pycnogonum litorale]
MFPVYMRLTVTLFCVVILVVGVVGNLLVPLVVWSNKDMRNSTNLFLVNLSFADLLVLVTCVPTVLIEIHSKPEVWIIGEAMCKYAKSGYRFSNLWGHSWIK